LAGAKQRNAARRLCEELENVMIDTLLESEQEIDAAVIPASLRLELVVTDADSIQELVLRDDGRDRSEYSLCAMRIGLLSLKHARGQIDADAVRREGDRLLSEMDETMESYRAQLHDNLNRALKDYFDPSSGRLQERLERLIKKDGELEQVLRRQIGCQGSELANTLAAHVGENSPLMKLLDPDESRGLVTALRYSTEEVLQAERARILAEFSLDNKDGALTRLLAELGEENGRLRADLENRIDEVTQEFSLDREDSALSRLVRKVEQAQVTISREFSLDNDGSALTRISQLLNETTGAINTNLTLDNDGSALSRLRRELLEILKRHEDQANSFHNDVTSALEAMKARREESLRSTTHGRQFEDVVVEFVKREAERAGDIAISTVCSAGAIKYCKVGDAVVELGPDCAAAGERFVVEAKEDSSYDLRKALLETETARKNRDASVGVFVFSKTTAPEGQDPLLRYGNDIAVVWDSEDLNNDVILKAALSLARALCVRLATSRTAETADFQTIDSAILVIETEAKRLAKMKGWVETIGSNSTKVLDEIRKMTDAMDRQIGVLRTAVAGLKGSTIEE
jgi:hypothetical protein